MLPTHCQTSAAWPVAPLLVPTSRPSMHRQQPLLDGEAAHPDHPNAGRVDRERLERQSRRRASRTKRPPDALRWAMAPKSPVVRSMSSFEPLLATPSAAASQMASAPCDCRAKANSSPRITVFHACVFMGKSITLAIAPHKIRRVWQASLASPSTLSLLSAAKNLRCFAERRRSALR